MESVSSVARKKSASDGWFLLSSEEKGRQEASDVWRARSPGRRRMMGDGDVPLRWVDVVSFWRQWRRSANMLLLLGCDLERRCYCGSFR